MGPVFARQASARADFPAARTFAASLAGFETERLRDRRHLLGLLLERLGQVVGAAEVDRLAGGDQPLADDRV
jgi:hypothetical protein